MTSKRHSLAPTVTELTGYHIFCIYEHKMLHITNDFLDAIQLKSAGLLPFMHVISSRTGTYRPLLCVAPEDDYRFITLYGLTIKLRIQMHLQPGMYVATNLSGEV